MKTRGKRILSLMLCLVMVLTLLPTVTLAADREGSLLLLTIGGYSYSDSPDRIGGSIKDLATVPQKQEIAYGGGSWSYWKNGSKVVIYLTNYKGASSIWIEAGTATEVSLLYTGENSVGSYSVECGIACDVPMQITGTTGSTLSVKGLRSGIRMVDDWDSGNGANPDGIHLVHDGGTLNISVYGLKAPDSSTAGILLGSQSHGSLLWGTRENDYVHLKEHSKVNIGVIYSGSGISANTLYCDKHANDSYLIINTKAAYGSPLDVLHRYISDTPSVNREDCYVIENGVLDFYQSLPGNIENLQATAGSSLPVKFDISMHTFGSIIKANPRDFEYTCYLYYDGSLVGFADNDELFYKIPAGSLGTHTVWEQIVVYCSGTALYTANKTFTVKVTEPQVTTYDYYIDRVQITEANQSNVLGDGTVKFYPKGEYDPSCNVLELTNFHLYTNSGLGYHKYNKEGDIAAMYLGEDTIVILHGNNYISGDEAYEGIVTGEDCKLEFKGDGFLNVDVGTENVAMVAPGGTITVSQQAEVEFYGSNGLEMPYAGGNVTVKDDAKFYCFGYQRNSGYDGGGFIGKGITVQNHGVFTAVSQYNGEAITTWVEEYPSSVYDIKILKKGEYTSAFWSWDHQAHQPYLIQNGLNTTGGVFEGECRYINITARTTDCGGNPNACALSQFKDVPGYSNWAHKGIEYCVSKGLMSGTSATMFSPKTSMSRAMLVTVLYRMAGQPGAGQSKFSDVPANQWYSAAVSWAADKGIVSGVGGGRFDPNGNVTREQIATILFRYASFKGYNTSNRNNLAGFADAGKVGSWFIDGMKWAVAEGLITGTVTNNKTYLNPQGAATREQVAAILMRFLEK